MIPDDELPQLRGQGKLPEVDFLSSQDEQTLNEKYSNVNYQFIDNDTNNDNNGSTSDKNQDDGDGGIGDGKKFELLLLVAF